jgi:DNA-binding MarR family transcriptional regulator
MPSVPTDGAAILGRARRIASRARRGIEAVFVRHGLDTGEFDVLAALRRSGAPFRLRPTELYRSLMISSGGLTDRLRRLEEAGLVRRDTDEADGRSLLVELTETGRRTVEAAFADDMAVENRLVSALTCEERLALARLLERLALGLEA